MTSLRHRLAANFGANALGRVSSVAIQIVSVPVMLSHWGTGRYGEWLLLSSIPAYLAMSDIGFGNVAGNEMTMLVACNRRQEALGVFQSVSLFIAAGSVAVAGLLVAAVWTLPLERWLRIRILTAQEMHGILLLLGLSALLSLQEGFLQQSFRCAGQAALGIAAKSAAALLCFAGVMAAVFLGADPLTVALTMALLNALGTFALWRLLRRRIAWIRFGVREARLSTIRRLWCPALLFMGFPVANVLSLQGTLIVVGAVFGPVAVVTFSTARTISRSVLQALQLINASVWPEISAAFGGGQLPLLRRLHRASCQISIAFCLGTTLLVGIAGSRIWTWWTVGRLQTDPALLYLFLAQMLIGALWYTSSVVPAATNRHRGVAVVILASSCASLAASLGLMKYSPFALRGAALGLIAGDAITATFVLRTSLRLTGDNWRGFCLSLLRLPALPKHAFFNMAQGAGQVARRELQD